MGELRPCNDDTCHLHVETLLGLWPRDPALEPCFRCFSTAKPVVNMFAELETCKKRQLHLDWMSLSVSSSSEMFKVIWFIRWN